MRLLASHSSSLNMRRNCVKAQLNSSSIASFTDNNPLVSIVILNYNGKQFLYKNLTSVFQSDYPNFEVILVDNGSSDESVYFVKSHFGQTAKLKIIVNSNNLGASEGRNIGIKHARGEILVFLDNDTFVHPQWLAKIVKAFREDRSIGAVQCKILRAENPELIDSTGGFLDYFAFATQRGLMELDVGQYNAQTEIFYAGGAFAFKRAVLNEIGLFDPAYFVWYEETDLCWRTWLSGYRIVYLPNSIVYHYGSGTTFRFLPTESTQRWLINQNTIQIKNYGILNLFKYTFPYIAVRFAKNMLSLKKSPYSNLISKSILITAKNFKTILKKRIIIQLYRRKSKDDVITRHMIQHGWKDFLLGSRSKAEIKNPCERTGINEYYNKQD